MAITISDTEPRVQYTATSGQTSFAVPFEFFTTADIKVFNGTSQLTFNASPSSASQYSVSGAGVSGGGSITLGGSGATLNDVITIFRDLAIARSTDFPTSGAFQISSLNDELDKIIAMCQQLERDLKFSPKAAATTANTFDITFPNLAANKVLSVNSSGNGLEFSQDITDITTIAAITSDVTTVSGIAANVTTVAGVSANVTTVANNITSVNTVANNIADIVTVANDLNEAVSEIETVASDLQEATPEIDTVAGSITNVNTVGNNIANVNTVGGISANVTTVAGISSNVTTVAGISSDITAVALDASDIGIVASNINPIGIVSTISSDVSTVAGISSDISTVSGISSNVTSVAGIAANVTTVANNISGVNSFAERYRVGSSDPSSSLDEGDLAYNSTSNELKYYNGSAWVAIVADTDVKTKVSANDTTAGFLNGKLVAGTNVTFTETNDGGNETLSIAATDNSIPFAIALG